LATWICCCCCQTPYKRVYEGYTAAVQEFGKFTKVLAPGLHYVNPCTEELRVVDKRERVLDIRKQNCFTKDNIDIWIDAVVYFKIEDTYRSLYEIADVPLAVTELSRTALRDIFGTITLQEALEDRDTQAFKLRELVQEPTDTWGVNITRVLIQEVIFKPELQRSLSTKVVAEKQAESKVIGAKADVRAAELMRTAADTLGTPAAMQIRYLEALTSLSGAPTPKVLFFPSDFSQIGSAKLLDVAGKNSMN